MNCKELLSAPAAGAHAPTFLMTTSIRPWPQREHCSTSRGLSVCLRRSRSTGAAMLVLYLISTLQLICSGAENSRDPLRSLTIRAYGTHSRARAAQSCETEIGLKTRSDRTGENEPSPHTIATPP